jgi:hypothetical protein
MTTGNRDERLKTQGPMPPARKRWPWWAYLTVAGIFVLVVNPVVVWIISSFQASQKLAVLVAKVRERKEPLTTVELNDYYKPALNRPDMTAEIEAALSHCGSPALAALAKDLPIVGTGAKPPLPSESWPQLPDVEAYLAQQAPAVESLDDFVRRNGTVRFPIDLRAGLTMPYPHVAPLRNLARVLALQFDVDLYRGRTGDAVDRILAQLALARTLETEPTLISQLVRLAVLSIARAQTQDLMRQVELEDSDLARLQDSLRQFDEEQSLKRALAGERTFAYLACVAAGLMTDDWPVISAADAIQLVDHPPRRVHDAAKMLEFSLRIAEAADESLASALRESQQVDADALELAQHLTGKFLYRLTLLNSSNRAFVSAFVRWAAKRDCADAALATERYRLSHHQWPETLEQLVPEYLPAVLIDPFNGQPMKMLVTSEELTIYSVGTDREDNRGKLSEGDEAHTDLGFVVPKHRGAAP